MPPRTTPTIPYDNPITDKVGRISKLWTRWFSDLSNRLELSASRQASVRLPVGSSGTVEVTPFALGIVQAGVYRISGYMRVTQPATTSSSFTLSLHWTDGGVPCSVTFAAVTGNTTSTTQSFTYNVRVDTATAIGYAVAYVSVGAVAMEYRLDVNVEALNLE